MNEKISIIIPAYNTADVISRTLKSVENQTYKNYEMIIINDGSTDGTKDFLDNYKKNKANVIIHHQENQGVSAARNKGLEMCTGDYVCFLDSDDTYEPLFFENMLKSRHTSKADIIYCSFSIIEKSGKIKKEKLNLNNSEALSFYFDNWLHLSTFLIKKDYLAGKSIKFDIQQKVGEDSVFTVKLLLDANTAYVEEHLFNYHYRKNSVTKSCTTKSYYINDLNSWNYIAKYIKDNYKNKDRKEVIFKCLKHRGMIEINYLTYLLFHCRFKELKKHIENNGLGDLEICQHIMPKCAKRKCKFISRNNYISFFIGMIYYRYIRRISL